MPNHVLNELIFYGVDAEMQSAILAQTCCGDGKVDFSILVPEPLNMWRGSVGSQHEKAFGRTGLDWNRTNWGTKWNAYSHQPTLQTDDSLTLIFETAWSPPYPWLAAVMNKLSLPFDHNWLNEGMERAVSGRFWFSEQWGPEWKEEPSPEDTHRRLHKLHWGVEQFEDEA